jgi:hypothetical protein
VLFARVRRLRGDFEVLVLFRLIELVTVHAEARLTVLVFEFEVVSGELLCAFQVERRLLVRRQFRRVPVLPRSVEGGAHRVSLALGRLPEFAHFEVRPIDRDEHRFHVFALHFFRDDQARALLTADEVVRFERAEFVVDLGTTVLSLTF